MGFLGGPRFTWMRGRVRSVASTYHCPYEETVSNTKRGNLLISPDGSSMHPQTTRKQAFHTAKQHKRGGPT
jgi:hypothetical protein